MPNPKAILFVCTGNTCRSPMAEALLRDSLADRKDITVGSAGVMASNGGSASRETREILKHRNIRLDGFRSRPVTKKILDQTTHVFAMTESHLAHLEARFPEYSEKYYLLREFTPETANNPAIRDVPDPIGMGLAAYEEVAEVIEAAIPSIIAYVDATA